MPALIVINVADPPPGLRLHLRSTPTPTPALAVTNRSVPLAAIETPTSPTAITLNIPTNTRAETLLSRILMAHRDGKTRRNCNPSSRLSFTPKSPSPLTPSSHVSSNTPTIISDDSEEEQDWCEDDDKDDDSAFVEFEMVTGPMASCKIKLSSPSASPSPSDGCSSDSDSTTTQTEQGSSSSGFSTLSSSTLVHDDDDIDEGHFRIHEFTDVNKLIGASPAMHRSSFFVFPLEDRRRPSYYHHHIKQHPSPHITQGQYPSQGRHQHQVDEDEASSAAAAAAEPTFNFGFDADPYLDEDFGVLARQQQQQRTLEAEAHAWAHARSVKIVEPAKRTKKDVRKTMSFGKIKSKSTSPARFSKRVRRVPVPRYEDLDSSDTTKTTVKSERMRRVPVPRYEDLDYPDINKDTRTSDTHTNARKASSVICTEESGKGKRKNSSEPEPWIATQQEVLDLVWGSRPIDLAQYWGSGKRRMTID